MFTCSVLGLGILPSHPLVLVVKDKVLLLLSVELPESGEWRVEEGEVGRRRDLRETHLVFSIDPQGCEDVDDTLSVRY